MENLEQIINEIKKIDGKENIRKLLKKEYDYETHEIERFSERLENAFKKIAVTETEDDYSTGGFLSYYLYALRRTTEIRDNYRQLYKDLFEEEIDK